MNVLLTKSLRVEDVSFLFNFPKELLSAREQEMVKWIKGYVSEYSVPPTVERFSKQFDSFIPLESTDPLGDIYQQQIQKSRNVYTRHFLVNIQEKLKEGDDPLPYIAELHQKIGAGDKGVTYYSTYDRSLYHRRETAYPYEIDQIDKYTGGIGNGDLIYLIGRLGVGKTSFAVWIITKWLQRGRRILVASNENRADDVVAKIDSFIGGWNPIKKRTKDWTEDEIERIKTVSYIASRMDGEVIIPNRPVQSVDEMRGLVLAYHPDIVVIDGIYLMNGAQGESGWEKITDVSRNLKRLAEGEGVPVVGLHQASRNAVGKRVEVEHVAYSDALAQDADQLYGINKEEDGSLFVECIKNRWGSDGWGLFVQFYWETMYAKVMDGKTALEEE